MPTFVPRELRETADISRGRFQPRQVLKLTLIALAVGVGAYVALGFLADAVAEHVSDEMEVRVFGDVSDALEGTEPPPEDLLALFDGLWASPRVTRKLDYRLFVLDEEVPNAFALPGGAVGITRGLLEHVHTRVGRAFVLAHELGHHEHRHALRRLGRRLLVALTLGLVQGSAGGSTPVLDLSEGVLAAGYSRAEEAEADAFAVTLVREGSVRGAFADADGMLEFFRWVLCGASDDLRGPLGESSASELFASHPLTLDRVNAVRAALGLPAVDLPTFCGGDGSGGPARAGGPRRGPLRGVAPRAWKACGPSLRVRGRRGRSR